MVTAVITGASSGLGKEYIRCNHQSISQRGRLFGWWHAAKSFKGNCPRASGQDHCRHLLDLGEEESLEIFEKLLKENQPEIKVLVNNAGYGKCTDFFTSNRESQTGMVDLNCRALTGITRLCLPYMLDDSLVLNIASIAAFAPTPRMTVYCATKAYAYPPFPKRFTRELRPRGHSGVRRVPRPHGHGLLERGGRTRGEIPPD